MLLVLPSRRKSSRLRCRLEKVDLDDPDRWSFGFYEALSYTWGDMTDKENITVDGHPFDVTHNLAVALRRLRAETTRTILWVDAICINQRDTLERNSQVMKMKAIYERAETVLVWLGPEADDSNTAMSLIDRISQEGEEDWVANSITTADPDELRQWEALARLFARSWWRRVWVVQEVAVAQDVRVLCGERLEEWDYLVAACTMLTEFGEEFESIAAALGPYAPGHGQAITMSTIQEEIEQKGSTDLYNMLLQNRSREATDPRDRVFAALGMVGDEANQISADYDKTLGEVYREAVLCIIERSKALEVLSACQDPERKSGLPSWVPDLESDWKARILRDKERWEQLYRSAGDSIAAVQFQGQGDDSILVVKGIMFDRVAEVANVLGDWASANEVIESWRQIARRTLSQRQPSMSDEAQCDEFRRTLVADQNVEGDRLDHSGAQPDTANSFSTHVVDASRPIPRLNIKNEVTAYRVRLIQVATRRRLLGTRQGRIGLASEDARAGDRIGVLLGAGVPFILRPHAGYYTIVGEACK